MKPNIYQHNPSEQLAEDFAILFASTPSFLKCYQDVFLNHTHVPHAAFHFETPLIGAKRRQIGNYPVKGEGC